jgi:hypothetical protein
MYTGYVFLCASESLKDCLRHKLFTCSGEKVQVVREMEVGSIVFLFNMDSNTLVGPFTAAGSPRTGLEPGGWTEVTETQNKTSIRVEREELHEMKNAQDKFPFLKDINTCKLSHFQTQDLLNTLKEAPLLSMKQSSARKQT